MQSNMYMYNTHVYISYSDPMRNSMYSYNIHNIQTHMYNFDQKSEIFLSSYDRQNHVIVGIKALLRIPNQVAIRSLFPEFVLVFNVSGDVWGNFLQWSGFPDARSSSKPPTPPIILDIKLHVRCARWSNTRQTRYTSTLDSHAFVFLGVIVKCGVRIGRIGSSLNANAMLSGYNLFIIYESLYFAISDLIQK
jgi:hypothetical protein